MKKIAGLSAALMLIIVSVHAQTISDANVFGHVINKSSGEHLPYVNIGVLGTTIGCITDPSGHYSCINLPPGTYMIVASAMGYKRQEKQIMAESGKTIEVNFELEEDHIQLDVVVVSSSREETNRKETSSIVNVITPRHFEQTNSSCLAQSLNFQPGLRVETNCQNCGFQQVRINGLDGPYSQILIDSRPVFSALAGVYGIEQIPVNMIERVEIMRGGGSALFGSNAIAGTINIITKDPSGNSVSVSNNTSMIGGKTMDVNNTFNASIVSSDKRSGLVMFGSTHQRAPYDHDGDGFSEIGKIEGRNIGMRTYFNVNQYNKLSFEYHNLGEFRRGGNRFDLQPHETEITEQVEHAIHAGSVKYDLYSKNSLNKFSVFASLQKIHRDSYYGAQHDPNAYGKTDDLSFVSGTQFTRSFKKMWFMPAKLTVGGEYFFNTLEDQMPGYGRVISQQAGVVSAFAQNEWKTTKMTITSGARFDKHNMIGKPVVSPRASIRYSPSEKMIFRTSWSSGFRAPQAFDEDLHITAVGGEVVFITLSPDLRSERSQSISASADFYRTWGKTQINFLLEGFYTHLTDVFYLEEIGTDAGGNLILERRNGAGAVVSGLNVEGKIAPSDVFQLQFGFTLQEARYDKPLAWSSDSSIAAQQKMFRTPDRYGYLTAAIQPMKKMSWSTSAIYTGPMLVQHFAGYIEKDQEEKTTPDFFDVMTKITFELKASTSVKVFVSLGVQNIFNSYQNDFDQGEFRDAGYIYGPALPRSYFMSLKMNID